MSYHDTEHVCGVRRRAQARAGDGGHSGAAAEGALSAVPGHAHHMAAHPHTTPGRFHVRQALPNTPLGKTSASRLLGFHTFRSTHVNEKSYP